MPNSPFGRTRSPQPRAHVAAQRPPGCKGDDQGGLGTRNMPGFAGYSSPGVGNFHGQVNTHAPGGTLAMPYEAQAGSKMGFCSRVVCSELQRVKKANTKGGVGKRKGCSRGEHRRRDSDQNFSSTLQSEEGPPYRATRWREEPARI